MGGGSESRASETCALTSPTQFLLDSGFGLVANVADWRWGGGALWGFCSRGLLSRAGFGKGPFGRGPLVMFFITAMP